MALTVIALVGTACAGSSDEPTPTADSSTTVVPSSSTAPSTTTPTSVPPVITTNTVAGGSGESLTTVDGDGPATFAIPAAVGIPAILHAKYDGDASFVVTALDAQGKQISVLANSLGAYNGTVPVGFVDASANRALRPLD